MSHIYPIEIRPITGYTSKLLTLPIPGGLSHTPLSSQVYLAYSVKSVSGNKAVVQIGTYVDATFLVYLKNPTDTPEDFLTLRMNGAANYQIKFNDGEYQYLFDYNSETYIHGTPVSWEVMENAADFQRADPYPCYATYRIWIPPVYEANENAILQVLKFPEFVLSASETTKVTLRLYGRLYDQEETFYLGLYNSPYITYPAEITDEMDGFNIEYHVPTPSKMDYISFGILDNDELLSGYKLASPQDVVYTFRFSEQDKELLYNRFNTINRTAMQLAVRYKNFDGDPVVVTYPIIFNIVVTPPTLEYTVKDVDEFTRSLTGRGDEGVVIKGKSDIQFTLTPRAYKNASIEYYSIRNDGLEVSNKETVVFKNTEYSAFTLYIRDSRGNVHARKVTLDMVNYFSPTCNIAADPPKPDNTIKVIVNGRYYNGSFGEQDNFIEFKYKYTSNIASNDIDWTPIVPHSLNIGSGNYNTTLLLPIPNQADTYTITFQVTDIFGTVQSNSVTVKSTPVFDWGQHDFKFNVPVTVSNDLIVTGQIIKGDGTAAIADDPAMDYIVEQGIKTTGSGNSTANWVYRKWNSGVAECWCRKHIQTGVSTAWGGLYVSGALPHTNIVWPINFTDIPVANITIAPNASGAFLIAGGSTNLTATNTGGYEIARGTSLSSGNFYINYYGIGQWK